MLSGKSIHASVRSGLINIEPYNFENLGPNSYDLRLGQKLKTYVPQQPLIADEICLDAREDNPVEEWVIPNDGFILKPGILYLGHTQEVAGSNHYIPCIEGRSSIARLGIQVHMTAGFGDIGFIGQWTLEIQVTHCVKIYPGIRICQIYFQPIVGDYTLYSGKYKNSRGVITSKLHKDYENG